MKRGETSSECSTRSYTLLGHSAHNTVELACGGQAFIATPLFDPSMSALPIIVKQNSQSVGLFTRTRERELGNDPLLYIHTHMSSGSPPRCPLQPPPQQTDFSLQWADGISALRLAHCIAATTTNYVLHHRVLSIALAQHQVHCVAG